MSDWIDFSISSASEDFWKKAVPVLFVGMIIWFLSTLLSGGYFGLPPIVLNLQWFIVLIVSYFVIWLIVFILSVSKNNIIAMILFFVASWITGVLEFPILLWAVEEVGLDTARMIFFVASFSGVFATIGGLLIGFFLAGKIGVKWYSFLIVFGVLLIILEVTLTIIYGFDTIVFFTSVLTVIWIFGVIIWDGSRLPETIEEGHWMEVVVNIYFDLIVIIIRLFIIIVSLKSSD